MPADRPADGLQIGEVLSEARRRAGLEIGEVEERTKIRTRYLRALEGEQWDVLPGHAYAKGFLRAYAQLLGLDADALVDEYRRRVEQPASAGPPIPEPVLRSRRRRDALVERPGGFAPSRGLVVGGLVLTLVAILAVLGITAGEDEPGERGARGKKRGAEQGKEERNSGGGGEKRPEPDLLSLKIVPNVDGTRVCLLDGDGEPVVESEELEAGREEGPFEAREFELRFDTGYDEGIVNVLVDGRRARFTDTFGPVAYEIRGADEIEETEYAGPACP